MDQDSYRKQITPEIRKCLADYQCQPILFVGSGFSKRYLDSPSWLQLLERLGKDCPNCDKPIGYYQQQHNDDLPAIGSALVEPYFEWAWGKGKSKFDPKLFVEKNDKSIFLKAAASKYFPVPKKPIDDLDLVPQLRTELSLFSEIGAHAVVTTNYDQLLDRLLPDYEPVVGQKVLRMGTEYVGEILKIHGCTSQPDSLVLTNEDYDYFKERKKYISAKLFTYFLEHPVFFFGYSASDPNIRSILSDIALITDNPDARIDNLFLVRWVSGSSHEYGQFEELIDIGDGRRIRVNLIETTGFRWIFELLRERRPISNVSPKLLRALSARMRKLIRTDIPKSPIELTFKTIEKAASSDDHLPTLLGLGNLGEATAINLSFPYTLTDVGIQLGYVGWHDADKLIKRVSDETGFDMKASDNEFHVKIKYGKSLNNKYSEKAVELLRKVRDGRGYKSLIPSGLRS